MTAEPGTIPVGGQFTVEGNFGGASIYVLPGRNASPGETAEPDATTPPGSSFSVTFTHEGSAGDLSVVAVIEASECGDTDHVTVTGAALPDTATEGPTDTVLALTAALFLGSAAIAGRRVLRRG